VGSVAIKRSYKGGDMSINPEAYQELNTGCCSRYYSIRGMDVSIGWVGVKWLPSFPFGETSPGT